MKLSSRGEETDVSYTWRVLYEAVACRRFPTAEDNDEKGEQKTFTEAMREFEELCDRVYLVAANARDAIQQRVNDTHGLAHDTMLTHPKSLVPVCGCPLLAVSGVYCNFDTDQGC